jgi:hypothetical protein
LSVPNHLGNLTLRCHDHAYSVSCNSDAPCAKMSCGVVMIRDQELCADVCFLVVIALLSEMSPARQISYNAYGMVSMTPHAQRQHVVHREELRPALRRTSRKSLASDRADRPDPPPASLPLFSPQCLTQQSKPPALDSPTPSPPRAGPKRRKYIMRSCRTPITPPTPRGCGG